MWQQSLRSPKCYKSTSVLHRLSKIFQPINVIPKNAEVNLKNLDITSKSQRLMMDLGLIKQASPGSFHFLPLGVRALEKLTRLVDQEMHKMGAQKVIFPTLTNAKLWKASGRLEDAASELFTLKDRHNHTYILSPTHEEAASDLIASLAPLSYKEFPLKLYQTTSKYRDEMKPRFGLMRGRQFIMKDLYTFDVNQERALKTYNEVCECYNTIFQKIGVNYVKVLGSSGLMGGSLSHEYHYKAPIGEDRLLFCSNCEYSANIELSGSTKCPKCGSAESIELQCGIEVGHTFFLGDKYSKALKAKYLSDTSKAVILQMGSYGLGLTRILAAALEVLSHEFEMRWPRALAPYTVVIIPPKEGSKEQQSTEEFPERLYHLLETQCSLENDVVLDDRNHLTIGRRMLDARRVGYPFIIVIGGKAANATTPLFELHDLQHDTKDNLSESDLLMYLNNKLSSD